MEDRESGRNLASTAWGPFAIRFTKVADRRPRVRLSSITNGLSQTELEQTELEPDDVNDRSRRETKELLSKLVSEFPALSVQVKRAPVIGGKIR